MSDNDFLERIWTVVGHDISCQHLDFNLSSNFT